MSDFARLLKDAAGAPPSPLDMNAVRQRAARLGFGRWRVWLFALVGLLGVGIPAGSALLPASDRPSRVETFERKQYEIEDTDTDSSRSVTVRTTERRDNATAASDASVLDDSPTGSSSPAAAPTRRGGIPGSGDPEASSVGEGCQASGSFEAVVVGFGEPPECTYTASVPGGYRTSTATWQIKIVRGARVIQLRGEADPICGDVGVIQPGDVVTARASSQSGASAPGLVQVGSAYHC